MSNHLPHVCFVAPHAYPLLAGDASLEIIGGSELQQVIVAKELAARGHPVSMICLNFGQPKDSRIDGIRLLRAHRPDEGVPMLRFIWPRLTSIWSCLRRADADIYYQRAAGMITGVVVAFCRTYDRKSIFSAAGNPDLVPNTPRIKFARDRWIYSYGLRHADRIFVQNDEQVRLCQKLLVRDPVLVRNCYRLPAQSIVAEGDRYILWVSTIRKLKRPELFLDMAEALPEQTFRMIGGPGEGESDLFKSITRRAATIKNLRFLGFLPFGETEKHFDAASLVINTSESEGFPNAFLQAWARAIPTVSFVDAGANRDGNPVGVRVSSYKAMILTVERLIADTAARAKEGERCAAYVAENHSLEKIIPIYQREFEQLALERRPTS